MIIDCLSIRDKWLEELELEKVAKSNYKALFIQVGDREDSTTYVNNKKSLCDRFSIGYTNLKFPDNMTEDLLIEFIEHYNSSKNILCMMVQLPLPSHINEERVINAIDPKKDLDGFTHINKGKLLVGDESAILPCTPYGIMKILESIDFDCRGKNVVVAGRSNIVGKPMVQLLINNGATVTCCNSSTDKEKFKELVFNSDLFISAIDKPNYYNTEFFGEENLDKLKNVIAIDVGIFRIDGELCGNIDKNIYDNFKAITPVPKGVGPMTVAGVLANIKKCYDINIEGEKEMNKFIIEMNSSDWDMDIPFEELIAYNKDCIINRDWNRTKHDNCYSGCCIYLRHPNSYDRYEIMIGLNDEGFTYLGEGSYDGGSKVDIAEGLIELKMNRDYQKLLDKNKGDI